MAKAFGMNPGRPQNKSERSNWTAKTAFPMLGPRYKLFSVLTTTVFLFLFNISNKAGKLKAGFFMTFSIPTQIPPFQRNVYYLLFLTLLIIHCPWRKLTVEKNIMRISKFSSQLKLILCPRIRLAIFRTFPKAFIFLLRVSNSPQLEERFPAVIIDSETFPRSPLKSAHLWNLAVKLTPCFDHIRSSFEVLLNVIITSF